jgi:hypothetical protein
MMESSRGNYEVVRTDEVSAGSEVRPNAGMDSRYVRIEVENRKCREN